MSVLSVVAVVGKRQRQRLGKHALGIGGAVLGMVDGGQGAQVLRILGQRGLDRRREARRDGQRLLVLVVARVGQEEAAPGVG